MDSEALHAHAQSRDTQITTNAPSVVQMESSKLLPWLMACCLLAGFAAAIATFALIESQHSERESRMLQYYVLEMDAKLIAAGIKKPEESVAQQEKRK